MTQTTLPITAAASSSAPPSLFQDNRITLTDTRCFKNNTKSYKNHPAHINALHKNTLLTLARSGSIEEVLAALKEEEEWLESFVFSTRKLRRYIKTAYAKDLTIFSPANPYQQMDMVEEIQSFLTPTLKAQIGIFSLGVGNFNGWHKKAKVYFLYNYHIIHKPGSAKWGGCYDEHMECWDLSASPSVKNEAANLCRLWMRKTDETINQVWKDFVECRKYSASFSKMCWSHNSGSRLKVVKAAHYLEWKYGMEGKFVRLFDEDDKKITDEEFLRIHSVKEVTYENGKVRPVNLADGSISRIYPDTGRRIYASKRFCPNYQEAFYIINKRSYYLPVGKYPSAVRCKNYESGKANSQIGLGFNGDSPY